MGVKQYTQSSNSEEHSLTARCPLSCYSVPTLLKRGHCDGAFRQPVEACATHNAPLSYLKCIGCMHMGGCTYALLCEAPVEASICFGNEHVDVDVLRRAAINATTTTTTT